MTNGEKIQKDFQGCEVCKPIVEDDIIHVIFADKKDSAIGFDWSWWNAEYKEPTTKNDLGVDCISREAVERIINKWLSHSDYELKDHIYSMTEKIHNLPSITPQPCEDAVSRQAVLEMAKSYNTDGWDMYTPLVVDVEDIEELPPVMPQEPRWIPVNERLPEDLEPVNITWVNHDPEPYYNDIKDKPFTATGVYFNGQWYWWSTLCTDILAEYSHNYDDIIDDAIEVTAWMPLPSAYKRGEEE